MPFVPALANATRCRPPRPHACGRPLVSSAINNNRNNASLPRAGD